jgi:DNA-binding HxlR family transcriptional regulator
MSPRHKFDPPDCLAVREVLARVGDKWTVQIVDLLAVEPRRFAALRRGIEGISQRMLTLSLRALQRDGLVSRRVYPTVPPSVEYALTPLGRTLRIPICALVEWAQRHREQIQTARDHYDLKSSG